LGPFFYSKKEIPANSLEFVSFRDFKFFLEIPPRAIILFLVILESNLNLFMPKKLLFFLNNEDKTIFSTFWSSLFLISEILWAEPMILNFFFKE